LNFEKLFDFSLPKSSNLSLSLSLPIFSNPSLSLPLSIPLSHQSLTLFFEYTKTLSNPYKEKFRWPNERGIKEAPLLTFQNQRHANKTIEKKKRMKRCTLSINSFSWSLSS
jgi:hypothetical protein